MIVRHQTVSLLIAIATASMLAACGSSIKLDEAPVTDAKGTQVSPAVTVVPTSPKGTQTAATQAGLSDRSVLAVNVAPATDAAAGPTGVVKVILFDYDSFLVKPEYQSVIDAHARFLTTNRTRKLAIEGHTDESGGREYNIALGQKRAEAVRRALGLLGVADAQLEAVSFGEEKPADGASNEQAYAKNRRAELNYR